MYLLAHSSWYFFRNNVFKSVILIEVNASWYMYLLKCNKAWITYQLMLKTIRKKRFWMNSHEKPTPFHPSLLQTSTAGARQRGGPLVTQVTGPRVRYKCNSAPTDRVRQMGWLIYLFTTTSFYGAYIRALGCLPLALSMCRRLTSIFNFDLWSL